MISWHECGCGLSLVVESHCTGSSYHASIYPAESTEHPNQGLGDCPKCGADLVGQYIAGLLPQKAPKLGHQPPRL